MHAPSDAPDLDGLKREYLARPSRTLRWIMGVAIALVVVGAVGRLLGDPDGWDVGLSVVQIVCFGVLVATYFVCPPGVRLDASGVRFRTFLFWGRPVRWDEVDEVVVQGRWQEVSTLVVGGRSRRLHGVPYDDACLLATATGTWRSRRP
jgi:hypothetical protein